jgi:hypothetical protein
MTAELRVASVAFQPPSSMSAGGGGISANDVAPRRTLSDEVIRRRRDIFVMGAVTRLRQPIPIFVQVNCSEPAVRLGPLLPKVGH